MSTESLPSIGANIAIKRAYSKSPGRGRSLWWERSPLAEASLSAELRRLEARHQARSTVRSLSSISQA
jgi:hypothetical protein